MREMKRADRAEEVNKLTQALAIRQQLALQEKQQLEASIQKISAIHTQVAGGNYQVRLPLDQQDALLSISGTINELLNQLQHKQSVENAVMQAFQDIQQAKQQGKPIQPRKTGTIVDELLTEVSATQPSSMTTPQHTPSHPRTPPLLNLPGYINTPREQPVYKKHL
jgi:HAMP domain-containing protein